jgi:hypothetical protein
VRDSDQTPPWSALRSLFEAFHFAFALARAVSPHLPETLRVEEPQRFRY